MKHFYMTRTMRILNCTVFQFWERLTEQNHQLDRK